MKKAIIIFNGLIYLFCFIINLVNIFLASINFSTLFQILFSISCLLPIYFILERKHLKRAYTFLWVINLIQAFSLIVFGLTFKLIIGPDFSVYFIDSTDFLVESSVKVFNLYSYFNYVKNGNAFLIGVNFIHLLLFSFFYFEAKVSK